MKFTEDLFAEHMKPITGSAIREIFKLLAKPGMISFAGGNPSMSALEPDVISELAQEVLAKYGATLLQYSHLDDGLYLFTGTLPTQRYFCRLNVSDPLMTAELDRYLEEALVDYVLVSWEELPPRFDRYQWIATDAGYDDQNRINKYLHLYRRK